MTHISVTNLGHHWFRSWLLAWQAPSHDLNQYWNIVNWTICNKLQWNLYRNLHVFIQENAFENVIWEINDGRFVQASMCFATMAGSVSLVEIIVCAPVVKHQAITQTNPDWLLTYWGRDIMDAISQTAFSSAFSWMKWILIKISLKFVPKGPINNIPALVQIMA